MGYKVLYEDYEDNWRLIDCKDDTEVRSALLEVMKGGKEPILVKEVDFSLTLSISDGSEEMKVPVPVTPEPSKVETKKEDKSGAKVSGPPDDKSSRGKS